MKAKNIPVIAVLVAIVCVGVFIFIASQNTIQKEVAVEAQKKEADNFFGVPESDYKPKTY